MITRRFDGSGNYAQDWDAYKQGFGNADGEYWLGNEYLHYLTSSKSYEMRFDLEDWDGNTAFAEYSSFVINSEADNYRLLLGDYSGNASLDASDDADSGFLYHHNQQFSTRARDNDASATSCVTRSGHGGGLWYKGCSRVAITGTYCQTSTCGDDYNNLFWKAWKGYTYSMKTITMMFRPHLPGL